MILSQALLDEYARTPVSWGFASGPNSLGELTYRRTYSRNGEEWWQTVARVVEGVFEILEEHCQRYTLPFDLDVARADAAEMYDGIFHFRWTPPGRGLWMMGTDFVRTRGSAALNNCGYCTTENIATEFEKPFCFMQDMSMLGVGVGFDTRGAGSLIWRPSQGPVIQYVIPDTREGWVESTGMLLRWAFGVGPQPQLIYSMIRRAGLPIKGFGGTSSGPEPLKNLHSQIMKIALRQAGKPISATDIVDVMNLIGCCTVAGNVRRTAQISLGEGEEFLDLKNYEKNPERAAWGWASNNSVFATVGMDYGPIAERIRNNGEPGLVWLDNIRRYGRMADFPSNTDYRAVGTNPCQPAFATLLTPQGVSMMGQVAIGDRIWTEDGWATVLRKWSTGVKPVFRYRTTAGCFIGTENHRILEKGVKIEVSLAKAIDILAGPTVPEADLDPQDIMDGLMLGDGTIHKASNNLRLLIVGDKDGSYHDSEIGDLISIPRFGVSPRSWAVTTTIAVEELPKVHKRRIPDRFFYGDARKVRGFLRGLFTANGGISGDRVALKGTSREVIDQAQVMLSSLGIPSYVTTNKPATIRWSNGTYTGKESYDLNITRGREDFQRLIGFIQPYKNERLRQCIKPGKTKSKDTYKIISVEYLGEHEVFDIAVDTPSHTYWTGGLNVSNCGEQTLENYELCTLVETYPSRHKSLAQYLRTLKYAYLYAKTVTLLPTHWPETNAVMMRNRRIGTSMSGVVELLEARGEKALIKWCRKGYKTIQHYDAVYSEWLGVRESLKKTSVKPSGTVSLPAGVTPGCHWPTHSTYIRRVRYAKDHPDLEPIIAAGYHTEPDKRDPSSIVVEFPVKGPQVPTCDQVGLARKIHLAALLQEHWADNQVSCTADFDPATEGHLIGDLLRAYDSRLKAISFLPRHPEGAYEQMPYEAIDEATYEARVKCLKPIQWPARVDTHDAEDRFCDGQSCQIATAKE